MKNRMLMLAFLLVSGSVLAQGTNNTLLSGSIPESTNHTVSVVQHLFGDLARLELGGGYTARFNGGVALKPSFSVMGLTPLHGTINKVLGSKYSTDWMVGPIYTYVPAWNENDAGLGASINLFRIPSAIGNMQAKVPIVDATTPKLTVAKAFIAAEVRLDELVDNPEFRLTIGGSLPF